MSTNLRFLTEQMPQNVFRAKASYGFNDGDLRHIFQLSGPRYDLDANVVQSTQKNQLVFGRNLDTIPIQQQLNNCLVLVISQMVKLAGIVSPSSNHFSLWLIPFNQFLRPPLPLTLELVS